MRWKKSSYESDSEIYGLPRGICECLNLKEVNTTTEANSSEVEMLPFMSVNAFADSSNFQPLRLLVDHFKFRDIFKLPCLGHVEYSDSVVFESQDRQLQNKIGALVFLLHTRTRSIRADLTSMSSADWNWKCIHIIIIIHTHINLTWDETDDSGRTNSTQKNTSRRAG